MGPVVMRAMPVSGDARGCRALNLGRRWGENGAVSKLLIRNGDSVFTLSASALAATLLFNFRSLCAIIPYLVELV